MHNSAIDLGMDQLNSSLQGMQLVEGTRSSRCTLMSQAWSSCTCDAGFSMCRPSGCLPGLIESRSSSILSELQATPGMSPPPESMDQAMRLSSQNVATNSSSGCLSGLIQNKWLPRALWASMLWAHQACPQL